MEVGRIDFGDGKGVRKLRGTSEWMRQAQEHGKKSIWELGADPIGGWPYIVWALVNGGAQRPISLIQADKLLDSYRAAFPGSSTLGDEISKAIAGYLHIELTKPDEETSDAPNADSQAENSPSGD